ncbi:hypothetical protein DENIS_0246 [Desulfonema ishimotonii]|uniref:PilC beta-propeller domain-containing protein n=1 Tax=Desulfonema ishimotonii TaxID=45657 RepID=A0A401FQR6_9BACT|nr:hypothetical protein DENIS_0246 [Desulfonema ishimotonii]
MLMILGLLAFSLPSISWGADDEIVGCAQSTSADYDGTFSTDDFDFTNVDVADNGNLILNTGQQAIDPSEIKVPFEQEIKATFLYEGAGNVSDFGWMLYDEIVDSNGNFKGWTYVRTNKLQHPLFIKIYDDNETGGCCGGGNGVLDSDYGKGGFPTTNETSLASYDDGSGVLFEVDGKNGVTPLDMTKSLGTFAGGTELVFFLTSNKRYDTSTTSAVFFTKQEWNPDYYNKSCTPDDVDGADDHWIDESAKKFYKTYLLGEILSGESSSCTMEQAWLAEPAFTRMNGYFSIQLSGKEDLILQKKNTVKMPHVIVGAPDNDPNQWILGWEDLSGGGDMDYNDMVFRIERKTGGTAALQSDEAISPTDSDSYYTAVQIEVWDYIPNSGACAGKTDINYYISVDGGDSWEEVRTWDSVYESNSSKNKTGDDIAASWTPGTPEYTYRAGRIDFIEIGKTGNALLWKAEMISENEACVPRIIDVSIQGSVANNAIFSRSSPIVQANVVYSGSYETPGPNWPSDERVLRGHLTATRVYDPAVPSTEDGSSATNSVVLWDAGQQLADMRISSRKIYFPKISYTEVTEDDPDVISGLAGDGVTNVFTGTLGKPDGAIIKAGSLYITDEEGREVFNDIHTDELVAESDRVGTGGWANRFTGEFSITYSTERVPRPGKKIIAWYTYYTSDGIQEFTPANVDYDELELNEEFVYGVGYRHDFNEDDAVDADDGNWLVNWIRGYKNGRNTAKAWPLGPVDHSAPAIGVPPGRPDWYLTLDENNALRKSFDAFRKKYEDRKTLIFIGARDGMLHAFDGGNFRWGHYSANEFVWGDNPDTDFKDYRGYFEWNTKSDLDNQTYTYGTGDEVWAFIPSNLLSRLKHNYAGGGDLAYVDASPAFADVYTDGSWRTVVISAQGNGGDSVFCLDVTDTSDAPKFMWEFVDPDLYRSNSSPAIAQVARVRTGGETTWVAFFVSGDTTMCSSGEESGYCYPSVFMIDIADGSVVKRLFLDSEPAGINGVPSGQPAVVDYDKNGFADRLYVGTDKGFLYKVNIPDDGSSLDGADDCVINKSFTTDDGDSIPDGSRNLSIYSSPTVVLEDGVVTIMYGTGDSPVKDDYNSSTQYNFLAYVDDSGKGECGSAVLDWFMQLPAGQKVFASAFASAGKVYFGTTTSDTEDPCDGYNTTGTEDINGGQLYVLDIDQGDTGELDADSETAIDTGNMIVTPVVYDEHVYYKKVSSSGESGAGGEINSIGGGIYNNAPEMTGTPQTVESWWREVIPE